jgi:predicted P-loop ATPase
MPVLEGKQGLGKSSVLQLLALSPEFYASDAPLHRTSKELIEQTQGKWIVEVSELSSMRKASIENMKQNITSQRDEARLAYGRLREDRPRQFILVGTTNARRYLADPSGNRRFVPLVMNALVDLNKFENIVPQLWAEALIKEKSFGLLQFSEKMWEENEQRCDLRLIKDGWNDTIASALPKEFEGYVTLKSLYRILELQSSQISPWTGERIAQIMKQLGYETHEKNLQGDDNSSLTCFCLSGKVDLENEIIL